MSIRHYPELKQNLQKQTTNKLATHLLTFLNKISRKFQTPLQQAFGASRKLPAPSQQLFGNTRNPQTPSQLTFRKPRKPPAPLQPLFGKNNYIAVKILNKQTYD